MQTEEIVWSSIRFYRYGFILLFCVAFADGATVLDAFENGSLSDWQTKDNARIEIADSGDAARGNALKCAVSFEKITYTWIRKNNLNAADIDPEKAGGISFFARAGSAVSVFLILSYLDEEKKEIRFAASVPVSDAWKEFKIPYSALKNGAAAMTSDDVRKCTWITWNVSRKNAAASVFWLDDVSVMPVAAAVSETPSNNAEAALLPEDPAWGKQHPRLLVNRDTLPAVIARTRKPGETEKAWKELLARCDRQLASADPYYLAMYQTMRAIDTKSLAGRGAYEGYFVATGISAELFSFAYLVTRERRYGEAAVKMMRHIAVNYPVMDFPGFFFTRSFFLRGAAITYDSCYDMLSDEERSIFRTTLVAWSKVFYERTPRESWETWAENTLNQIWNWNPGISGALGLACLAIMDETDEPIRPWLFQATRQVENFYRFGIDKNGGAIEGPSYIGYGAASTPFFIEALRQTTGEDLFKTTHYSKVGTFFSHEVLPGGKRTLNIIDASYGAMENWQVMLYALHRAEDRRPLAWCYRNLAKDVTAQMSDNLVSIILWWEDVPEIAQWSPASSMEPWAWSPWRGVMISRTGWKADDVLFSMHAQQYTLIRHDQVDKGQVNLFAYGMDFLIDSGYGNDGGMLMSQGSAAHNMVIIDGKGQIDNAASAHANTSGYLRDHLHTSAADFVRADLKDAWDFTIRKDYTKNRIRSMKKAQRHALFARGRLPYLIVYEDLAMDDNTHRYGIQWHTGAGNIFSTDAGIHIRSSIDGARYPVMAVQPYNTKYDGGFASPTAPVSEAGEMRLKADLPRNGRYQIWALATATGIIPAKSDSIHFSIDGGKAGFSGGSESGTFTWKIATEGTLWTKLIDNNGTLQVPALELTAGQHEFIFKIREEGAAILALLIAPAEETRPIEMLAREAGAHVLVSASDFEVSGPVKKMRSSLPASDAEAYIHLVAPGIPAFRNETFQTTRDGIHPRLTAEVESANPDFLWALVPYKLNAGFNPEGSIRTVPIEKGAAISIDVYGVKDLACRWDGVSIQADGWECDGHFFWLRRDVSGKPLAWTVAQAHSLKAGGRPVFQADGDDVTAVYDGKMLNVSARELRSLSADTVHCVINGIPVTGSNKGPFRFEPDAAKQRAIRMAWSETIY